MFLKKGKIFFLHLKLFIYKIMIELVKIMKIKIFFMAILLD